MKLIPLTKGLFAKVDDADFERFGHLKWYASKGVTNRTFYARHTGHGPHAERRILFLHRAILDLSDAPRAVQVDHRNGDSLDNRRENLRIATPKQNGANRAAQQSQSGYKGVYPASKRWRARIGKGPGSSKGHFPTPEEAARAYDTAAREKFGEFARLNFPGPGEIGCVVHAALPFDQTLFIEKCRKYHRLAARVRRAKKSGHKPAQAVSSLVRAP